MGARSYGPLRSRMPAFLEFSLSFMFPRSWTTLFLRSHKVLSGLQLPVSLRYNGGGEVWLVPNAAT